MSESSANQPIIPLDLNIRTEEGRTQFREIIKVELGKYDKQKIVAFATRAALRTAWYLEKYSSSNESKMDAFYFYWLRALTAAVTVNFIKTEKSKKVAYAAAYAAAYADAYAAYAAAADAAAYTAAAAYTFYTFYATATTADADAAAAAAADADAAAAAAADADAAAAAAADAVAAAYAAADAAAYTATAADVVKQLNADFLELIKNDSIIHTPLWLDEFKIDTHPKLFGLDSFWNTYLFSPCINGSLYKTDKDKLFFEGFLALPEEILATESAKAMQEFIENYIEENGKLKTTQSARLILLGNGGAGKTSLVKKLFNESLVAYEKSTPRIQVRDLAIKDKQDNHIDLSLWDFGGQVIMHSTHSFFISSRSTYIIACNQRANEQPDPWLKLLQGRVRKNQVMTVLIVYTHCDTAEHYGKTGEGDIPAPWRRDNTLQRQFKDNFQLVFFNVDLIPDEDETPGFSPLQEEIINRARVESKKPMTKGVNAVKEIAEQLEKDQQPFITHQQLALKSKDVFAVEDSLRIFRIANNYGYIFPERPLKDNEDVEDDFIWINQKHWLTYGVYRLINNYSTVNNHGVLTQDIIETALSIDKPHFIDEQGEIKKGESAGKEGLLYTSEGAEVLKRILINYRWAMPYHKRHDELLLPLATRLDEPEELVLLSNEYDHLLQSDNKATLLIEVELVNKPGDFFFKLATYLEPHLLKIQHLWRTGAVLHFYGNKETQAIIEMPNNVLSLKIMGRDRESFQQLLLINIKETLKAYDNISAHSSERICLEGGKSEMLSSDVINSLTSGSDTVQRIKEQLIERGRSMTTININGTGNNVNVGDRGKNQINNYDTSGKELIDELRKLSATIPETTPEKQAINKSIAVLEQAGDETEEAEKQSMYKKGIKLAKDAVALDKVVELGAEYMPLIMSLLNKF
ncbi:MAG: ADP-ribosylation factor-like protein [Methylococcaceae bacterium]